MKIEQAERSAPADARDDVAAKARVEREGIMDKASCRLDVAFRDAIAGATGNTELRVVLPMVNEARIPATSMIPLPHRDRGRGCHAAIPEALRARDRAAAMAAFEGPVAYPSAACDRALSARGGG
jgi:DNA-binding FadR family transcriptional regulator